MPAIVTPRPGSTLTIKGRAVPFSFHPVTKSTRRYGLQTRIFSTNPWAVIRQSIEDSLAADTKKQALAFMEQAQNFYESAQNSYVVSAKPLLYYYCFLNVAKAFCLKQGVRSGYAKAMHGIQEAVHPGGQEFSDSFLKIFRATSSSANLFDDLRKALGRPSLPSSSRVYELKSLSPQLLQGHRVWTDAAEADERFVEIHEIEFKIDDEAKLIWLNIKFVADDLTRLGITQKRLLKESGLHGLFRRVRCSERHRGSPVLCFEQLESVPYTGRAADKVKSLVDLVRPFIWTTVIIFPPYRKNYVYLCPSAEVGSMMPQVLSIYAYFYYLGSVTRYRPHMFDDIFSGRYGGHIQEIISNLPQQFLYMLASEFANREIAHAPTVR
jgi:hypothetical protein